MCCHASAADNARVAVWYTQGYHALHLKAQPVFLQGSATVEVALDWLCLHLPQEELPRRFAAGLRAGKAGSEVKVVKRAGAVQQQAQQQRSSRQAAADDWGLPPSESSEEEESDDDARLAPVDGSSKQAGGTAEDKEAAKAWILQQYAGEWALPAASVGCRC